MAAKKIYSAEMSIFNNNGEIAFQLDTFYTTLKKAVADVTTTTQLYNGRLYESGLNIHGHYTKGDGEMVMIKIKVEYLY